MSVSVSGDTGAGATEENTTSSENVTSVDNSLWIEIEDAVIDQENVLFTVHAKTSLPGFNKSEYRVARHHYEFLWLHDRYQENEQYTGYIIPPPPPRPDFDASRLKLLHLTKQQTLTEEEFLKMKKEVTAEYLATFKKTVAMHGVFLRRLAEHPGLRGDAHLRTFVEIPRDLSAAPARLLTLATLVQKTAQSLFKNVVGRSSGPYATDSNLLTPWSTVTHTTATHDEVFGNDANSYFEQQTAFLSLYVILLNTAAERVDRMTYKHKDVAEVQMQVSSCVAQLAALEQPATRRCLATAAECFDKCRIIEGRMASDLDLKLADTLRYHMREAHSAQTAIDTRQSCQIAHALIEAHENLEKARASNNKKVRNAEQTLATVRVHAAQLSARTRTELDGFHTRRVAAFRDSLVALAELEIKHARAQQELLGETIQVLKDATE